jgi:hypothetical protein
MPSVVVEKFLVLVVSQSPDDPLPVLLDDPKDPEGFQPLLFLNRIKEKRDFFFQKKSFRRMSKRKTILEESTRIF